MCQSVSASAVDRLIEELIFRAVQPASVELSLRAAEQNERDRERLHAHWKQRLERVQYDAGLAKRRYEAVDPDNRLVARELERQWEQKLTDLRQLEDEYARFCREQPRHNSPSKATSGRVTARKARQGVAKERPVFVETLGSTLPEGLTTATWMVQCGP